jgi:uncharacterized membrane-anchored protein YhcB (DUF1043 family)
MVTQARVLNSATRHQVTTIPNDSVPTGYDKHKKSVTCKFSRTAVVAHTMVHEIEDNWKHPMKQNIEITREEKIKNLLKQNKVKSLFRWMEGFMNQKQHSE